MDINLQTGPITVPSALPGARSADVPVIQKQQTQSDTGSTAPANTSPNDKPETLNPADIAEQKRLDQLTKAAENFFKDVYAVSDTTFTIYKDASGQYITRYTSLRDGKVTYVPEQQLANYSVERGAPRAALVEIQA